MLWILIAAALAVTTLTVQARNRQTVARHARANAHAAAAVAALGTTGSRALVDVLAHGHWTAANTSTVLTESARDRKVADQVLTGITHALALDPLLGRHRLDQDGVIAWTRLGMLLLDAGVPRKRLGNAISDAITIYDPTLPLRYTAWAYAASLGRTGADRHWRHAQITMDPVRRLARNLGADLTHPHPIATAAA